MRYTPRSLFVATLFGVVGLLALAFTSPLARLDSRPAANHIEHHADILIGVLKNADFNSTADQPFHIKHDDYIIRRIVVVNRSATNLTLAAGGVYTASSKGGTAIVPAAQIYTALTGSRKYVDVALHANTTTNVQTSSTLYLSLTTAQGSSATCDVYVFGESLP